MWFSCQCIHQLQEEVTKAETPIAANSSQLIFGCVSPADTLQASVRMLSAPEPHLQLQAAAALLSMARNDQQSKDAVNAAGALLPLVALLRASQPGLQEVAAEALCDWAAANHTTLMQLLQQRQCRVL